MFFFRMSKTVLKSLFRRPYTVKYPFGPRVYHGDCTRGMVSIDISKCILCGICQKKCPVGAISVKREEKIWIIDRLHCISCGSCTESCPRKCLTMESEYTEPVTEKRNDIYQQQAD